MRPVPILLVFTTLLLVGPEGLAARPPLLHQAAAEPETVLSAVPVSEAPRLDGVLDEPLWKDAPLFDRFLQQVPDEGKPATERTEVRIVYTRDNLYFGVTVFYSDPQKIIADELRRDSPGRMHVRDDTFSIILDTFHDHRNGYLFTFNALGARDDWACTDEGRHWNRYWDPVWDVATRVGPEGWSAEVEIPFKSLRYSGEDVEWGINFRRVVLHKNEWTYATAIPASYSTAGIGKLSSAGVLEGLDGITVSRNLEFKPFVTAAAVESRAEVTGDVPTRDAFQPGIDIKYGFTPNVNLDLTVNTDFSDVEVDQQQINLTRFGLFFPEKRDFFQEGRGIFDFGVRRGSYRVLPFFSRRIGLEDGRPVPIRGGARLTGKMGHYSVGFLGMRTKDVSLYPATSFSVLRLKRDVFQRSSVGVLFTDRRPTGPVNSSANQVAGLDANFAFFSKSKVDLFWARSSQDTPGTSPTSYRAHLLLESDLLGLETDWMRVGDTFRPEVGFVQRDDMDRRFLRLQVSPRPGQMGIRKVYFRSSLDYVQNLRGLLETRHLATDVEVEFDSADVLSFAWLRSYEALERPFRVVGLEIAPGEYRFDHWNTCFVSAQHRKVSATVDLRGGGFFDGSRRDLSAATLLKVNRHLFLDLDYSTSDIRVLAGDLRTHLVALRSSVALNTRLFGAALVQWNSVSREFGVNVRLRYMYRPGSDFYIVFNERMTQPGGVWFLNERSFIVKWTYLFRV